jgi:hypothetical protein
MFSTPRKGKVNKLCVTCGCVDDSPRMLGTEASEKKKLSDLIRKYGGIEVVDGYLCRSCESKLFRWERDEGEKAEFRTVCLRNTTGFKRAFNDSPSKDRVQATKRSKDSFEIFYDAKDLLFADASHTHTESQVCSERSSVFNAIEAADVLIKSLNCGVNESDLDKVVSIIFTSTLLADCIVKFLVTSTRREVMLLSSRTGQNRSALRSCKYDDLITFDWEIIFTELSTKLPFLFRIMASTANTASTDNLSSKVRLRLCVAYGIIMQTRCKELNVFQRLVTATLLDNVCDAKVSNFHVCILQLHSKRQQQWSTVCIVLCWCFVCCTASVKTLCITLYEQDDKSSHNGIRCVFMLT